MKAYEGETFFSSWMFGERSRMQTIQIDRLYEMCQLIRSCGPPTILADGNVVVLISATWLNVLFRLFAVRELADNDEGAQYHS